MTTILHVEDDADLAETVSDCFAAFGFRGTYLLAKTLEEAQKLLGEPPPTVPVDLVISDMNLPDGTGLDLVQSVRADPARAHVPIVILSGETDRRKVDRAYVLGANSYVSKGLRSRSISDVLSALYAHWLKDARLPSPTATSRTHQYLARAVRLRSRKASVAMQIAERLGQEDGAFWMDLALREGNLANLLAFLLGQLGSHELPRTTLEQAEAVQHTVSETLDELERQPVRAPEDTERYMRTALSNMRIGLVDSVVGQLFPNAPMATGALREVAATALEEAASWITAHASAADLREQVAQLRADASRLRTGH